MGVVSGTCYESMAGFLPTAGGAETAAVVANVLFNYVAAKGLVAEVCSTAEDEVVPCATVEVTRG